MIDKLFSILSENGDTSSLRLIFIVCTLIIFVVWSYLSITKGEFIAFNNDKIVMVLTLLGGKEVQKYFETKKIKESKE